jgi:hypothetical protein
MAIRGSFVLFGNIIPERQLKVKRKIYATGRKNKKTRIQNYKSRSGAAG